MSRKIVSTTAPQGSHWPMSVLLREQVMSALERLSQQQSDFKHADNARRVHDGVGKKAQFLCEVLAALDGLHPESLPAAGAGFGSAVVVHDRDAGTVQSVTLMSGPMLDIEAGHVSLASPLGRALLGTCAGDDVVVETPQRRMHLRILTVRTLQDRLSDTASQRHTRMA